MNQGHNSVANLRKTKIYDTNVDLVNDNVYVKFGLLQFKHILLPYIDKGVGLQVLTTLVTARPPSVNSFSRY